MIMNLKGTKTEKNLMEAFAGESMARNKYTYYASKAKKDGFVQIAALFEETANNEKEHAKIWFKYLHDGAVPGTLENLKDEAKLAKFKSILGNMDATEAEVREGMQIMKDIGAIEYNKKAAEDKIASAKAYLSILPESEDKEFMLALADYAINREV